MRFTITVLLTLFALCSCVKEPEYSGTDFEARSLKAWMKKNRPDLMGNYQTEGGYYVDVLKWGESGVAATENDFGTEAIMDLDTCWVYYNLTGYDLEGNLCSTRDEVLARMQATFADRTHYVPYGNYSGKDEYYAIVEGSYLAARNKLTLSDEYVSKNPVCQDKELKLRKGTKVRLYLPSTIGYGTNGSSAEGGYEGQYSLDASVPMIMDLEVIRVVKNPADVELDMVEKLVEQSNSNNNATVWMQVENTEEEDSDADDGDTDDSESSDTEDTEGENKEPKYYEGIYYTTQFDPIGEFTHLSYARPDIAGLGNPYVDSKRFANMAEFDEKLWKILDEKFADLIKKTDDEAATEVGEENGAIIWYVGRFLDGFIFDTNITEVKELAFNETDEGNSITYSVSSNKDEYINAWAHCIPKLKYGRWGALITTSGYAYGSTGVSGSTTTTGGTSSAYNALANLYNYYSMTSSSYYNPYGYYNYYNYYGGYNNYYDYEETTSTIDTEIAPYTPLVFYIFIEPTE